jgi:hypothetical protein
MARLLLYCELYLEILDQRHSIPGLLGWLAWLGCLTWLPHSDRALTNWGRSIPTKPAYSILIWGRDRWHHLGSLSSRL